MQSLFPATDDWFIIFVELFRLLGNSRVYFLLSSSELFIEFVLSLPLGGQGVLLLSRRLRCELLRNVTVGASDARVGIEIED